jgi:SAM-dependent methyltransferase
VRDRYAGAVTRTDSCCGPSAESAASDSCGCGAPSGTLVVGSSTDSAQLGYSADDLAAIPEGADLGLGCGNPLAVLGLREGETVLDLGSGAGIDCFIAAKRVGPTGRVIGVDMTPEMIARARRNATAGGYDNVEFRLGEIEHLPVADGTVDAIISNCVINLVPDKRQVFADALRALKPGGRLSVSDIVLLGEVPVEIRDSVDAYVACLSGAILRDEYLGLIAAAGFSDIVVTSEKSFDFTDIVSSDLVDEYKSHTGATDEQIASAARLFQSVRVSAVKPA